MSTTMQRRRKGSAVAGPSSRIPLPSPIASPGTVNGNPSTPGPGGAFSAANSEVRRIRQPSLLATPRCGSSASRVSTPGPEEHSSISSELKCEPPKASTLVAPVAPSARNVQLKRLEALVRATNIDSLVEKPGTSRASSRPRSKLTGSAGDLVKQQENIVTEDNLPWVEKYQPQSREQHFVHKKKVEEFEKWLQNKRGSNICLMSGNAGSGKTATVHLVAKDLGFEVKEWINPLSLTEYNPDNWKGAGDEVHGRSQLELFSDFLLRSSQYTTLCIKGRAKPKSALILVEDLPNIFYKDASVLHQILRNYKNLGERPLVFIVTDGANSSSSVFKLFPQSLLTELDIQHITFNIVAPSYIHKFFSNILLQESVAVDKSALDEIVTASSGDVRWAINNLQYRLQKPRREHVEPTSGFKRPLRRPIPAKSRSNTQTLGERVDSLFLFRALGKVLYAKRDLTDASDVELKFTGKLEVERRIHPLLEVPERIGDKIEVSPETFFNFLGQNYLSFFTSLDDVVKATGYLSDAAYMFSCWNFNDFDSSSRNYKQREAREEFGLSIAIRGLMHSNNHRVTSTWNPLRRPGLTILNTRVQSTVENARHLFTGPITQDFYPDNLPFYARLRGSQFRPDQLDFIKEVGQLKESGFAMKSGRELKDETLLEEDESALPLVKPPKKVAKKENSAPLSPRKLEVDYVAADGEYAIDNWDSS